MYTTIMILFIHIILQVLFIAIGSSNDTCSDEDGVMMEDVRVIDWKPTNVVALGEWEQYTTVC